MIKSYLNYTTETDIKKDNFFIIKLALEKTNYSDFLKKKYNKNIKKNC